MNLLHTLSFHYCIFFPSECWWVPWLSESVLSQYWVSTVLLSWSKLAPDSAVWGHYYPAIELKQQKQWQWYLDICCVGYCSALRDNNSYEVLWAAQQQTTWTVCFITLLQLVWNLGWSCRGSVCESVCVCDCLQCSVKLLWNWPKSLSLWWHCSNMDESWCNVFAPLTSSTAEHQQREMKKSDKPHAVCSQDQKIPSFFSYNCTNMKRRKKRLTSKENFCICFSNENYNLSVLQFLVCSSVI